MTRVQTHEIEIRVPVDAAWRALTDPDELVRWFVEEARVEQREGGAYWVSWGGGEAAQSRVDVWDPGRRLRLVGEPEFQGVSALEEPFVEEWAFESRGGTTVVRLVFSGLPEADDWAGIYDSMQLGWGLFFRNLRHYLERHAGEPRQSRYVAARSARGTEEVWRAVTGPDGLAADGALPPAGGRYEVTTADGDRLAGEVVHHEPGRALQLTLEPLENGLLTLAAEGDAKSTSSWATVATFGDAPCEPADRLAARIRRLTVS